MRQPHEGLPTGAGHSAATCSASQGAESGERGGSAGGAGSFNWKRSMGQRVNATNTENSTALTNSYNTNGLDITMT